MSAKPNTGATLQFIEMFPTLEPGLVYDVVAASKNEDEILEKLMVLNELPPQQQREQRASLEAAAKAAARAAAPAAAAAAVATTSTGAPLGYPSPSGAPPSYPRGGNAPTTAGAGSTPNHSYPSSQQPQANSSTLPPGYPGSNTNRNPHNSSSSNNSNNNLYGGPSVTGATSSATGTTASNNNPYTHQQAHQSSAGGGGGVPNQYTAPPAYLPTKQVVPPASTTPAAPAPSAPRPAPTKSSAFTTSSSAAPSGHQQNVSPQPSGTGAASQPPAAGQSGSSDISPSAIRARQQVNEMLNRPAQAPGGKYGGPRATGYDAAIGGGASPQAHPEPAVTATTINRQSKYDNLAADLAARQAMEALAAAHQPPPAQREDSWQDVGGAGGESSNAAAGSGAPKLPPGIAAQAGVSSKSQDQAKEIESDGDEDAKNTPAGGTAGRDRSNSGSSGGGKKESGGGWFNPFGLFGGKKKDDKKDDKKSTPAKKDDKKKEAEKKKEAAEKNNNSKKEDPKKKKEDSGEFRASGGGKITPTPAATSQQPVDATATQDASNAAASPPNPMDVRSAMYLGFNPNGEVAPKPAGDFAFNETGHSESTEPSVAKRKFDSLLMGFSNDSFDVQVNRANEESARRRKEQEEAEAFVRQKSNGAQDFSFGVAAPKPSSDAPSYHALFNDFANEAGGGTGAASSTTTTGGGSSSSNNNFSGFGLNSGGGGASGIPSPPSVGTSYGFVDPVGNSMSKRNRGPSAGGTASASLDSSPNATNDNTYFSSRTTSTTGGGFTFGAPQPAADKGVVQGTKSFDALLNGFADD